MRGSMARGTSKMRSRSSSHSPVSRFISMVREALVASVTCAAPLVSFQISQVSTLPNSSSPSRAFCRAPGTFSRIQRILLPEKYASITRPVRRVISAAAELCASSRAIGRRAAALPDDGGRDRDARWRDPILWWSRADW